MDEMGRVFSQGESMEEQDALWGLVTACFGWNLG